VHKYKKTKEGRKERRQEGRKEMMDVSGIGSAERQRADNVCVYVF
jgi:hypothetical protein